MAIENAMVVDETHINEEAKRVFLVIVDELSWDNENEHLKMLEDKVNSYIKFYRSGQVLQLYPESEDYEVVITAVFKEELSEYAKVVASELGKSIENLGLSFVYNISEAQ